jgi:hypothetical protein
MCRNKMLVQVVLWSLLPAGLAFAEEQGSIIDPNGGTSRSVLRTTQLEDPPPVPNPVPVLAPGPVVPAGAVPAPRAAGRNRRAPALRAALDPQG